MKPLTPVASLTLTFAPPENRLGFFARLRRAMMPRRRPPADREHDPRKAESTRLDPATPAHLLGSGGRAEFFRLPRF